jgi:hypothetical protein
VKFGIPRPRDPKALAEPLKPNLLPQQYSKNFSTGLPTDGEANAAAQAAPLSLLTRRATRQPAHALTPLVDPALSLLTISVANIG